MRGIIRIIRQIYKTPSFAITIILTIALGIGANTAIFTLIHAVLLRSLPVRDPKMLFRLGDQTSGGQSDGFPDPTGGGDFSIFSYDLYQNLRQNIPALQQMAAMQSGGGAMNVRRGQEPAKAETTEYVSGNYFETLGIGIFAGRALTTADDMPSAAPAAVMSYAAWQANYGGDLNVIGQTFTFQNHPVTLVGIAQAGFYGDRLSAQPAEFWLPLSLEPVMEGRLSVLKNPSVNWLDLIVRVPEKTDISALAAQVSVNLQTWLKTIADYQQDGGVAQIPRQHVVVTPGGAGIQNLQKRESKGLYLLMGICLLVLLVACANVANLLLARGTTQRANISLRMALGAARIQLLRQMMTESLVLACLGGLAGMALAYGGTRMILALAFPHSTQLPIHPNPSLSVLGFALLLSLATGVVFGIVPAWITSNTDPAEALRGINRSMRDSASMPQRWLIVFQASLSLLLLVGAGMFTRSLNNLQHQNLGLQTDNRYIVHFDPEGSGYTRSTLPSLYQELENKFRAKPGVAEVGLAVYSPLQQESWFTKVYVEGRGNPAGQHDPVAWDRVNPQYFKAVGQSLVVGRAFTEDDTATSQRVAIVSRSFVTRYFPAGNAIGRHFGVGSLQRASEFEIVGVVSDAKYRSPEEPADPMFFLPLAQAFRPSADPTASNNPTMFADAIVLHLKTPTPNPESLVRSVFAGIDPNLSVNNLQTFSDQISGNFNQNRLISRLTSLFGALALILAAVGIYGVTSYQVSRRTSEIGVRMALGANRADVLRMVMNGALKQVGLGLAIGIPVAIMCAHSISSQLYEVRSYDPFSLLLAVATLLVAAAAAGILPARRAASIEPVTALRSE